MIVHPIPPFYCTDSRILILGSFPSVKSREQKFFYGHPQNRFWRVTSAVLGCAAPQSIDEKKAFLRANGIALWDVISSCDITGSSDSSIKNVIPNDISHIIKDSAIARIFANGKTAYKYYNIYIRDRVGTDAMCLPSTSPANAAWTESKLICEWNIIKNYIGGIHI